LDERQSIWIAALSLNDATLGRLLTEESINLTGSPIFSVLSQDADMAFLAVEYYSAYQ
jgi:hypothetical protein